MSINIRKHIILLGHRKQHGKDTCCDILEEYFKDFGVDYHRTFFAKHLKFEVAEKYNLDASQMEFDDYKNWKPQHLNGESVRDVLIRHGQEERAKWKDVWAYKAYRELFEANKTFGIISDFRFPNEYDSYQKLHSKYLMECAPYETFIPENMPIVHKILVHRPDGKFVNDGADDQLPDIDEDYWDYIMYNNTERKWRYNLKKQIIACVEEIFINNGFEYSKLKDKDYFTKLEQECR